jgi:hypothetical protein
VSAPEPPAAEPQAAASPAYLDMTVGRFLDALSATTPDPSGGGVAALAVALAAGLCVMTAGLSARQLPEAPRLAEQARRLRDRAAPLAQADAEAYRRGDRRAPGSAMPRPPASRRWPPRCRRPPWCRWRVAEIGAEVAALAAASRRGGNPNVRGDAVTAALLAAAGSRAAAALVRINLAGRRATTGPPALSTSPPERPASPRQPNARSASRPARGHTRSAGMTVTALSELEGAIVTVWQSEFPTRRRTTTGTVVCLLGRWR